MINQLPVDLNEKIASFLNVHDKKRLEIALGKSFVKKQSRAKVDYSLGILYKQIKKNKITKISPDVRHFLKKFDVNDPTIVDINLLCNHQEPITQPSMFMTFSELQKMTTNEYEDYIAKLQNVGLESEEYQNLATNTNLALMLVGNNKSLFEYVYSKTTTNKNSLKQYMCKCCGVCVLERASKLLQFTPDELEQIQINAINRTDFETAEWVDKYRVTNKMN